MKKQNLEYLPSLVMVVVCIIFGVVILFFLFRSVNNIYDSKVIELEGLEKEFNDRIKEVKELRDDCIQVCEESSLTPQSFDFRRGFCYCRNNLGEVSIKLRRMK